MTPIEMMISHLKTGWGSLAYSAKSMAARPGLCALAMACDALLLVSLGAVTELFGSRVVNALLALGTVIIPQSTTLPLEETIQIIGGPGQGAALAVIYNLVLMASGAFVAFCVFAGSSWKIAYDLAGKRHNYLGFIPLFTRASALMLPAFVLYEILGYLQDFNAMAAQGALGPTGPSVPYAASIVGAATAYFSLLTLSMLERNTAACAARAALRHGTRRIVGITLRSLPVIMIIAAVEILLRATLDLGEIARLAGAVIVLATATLFKVSTIKSLETIQDSRAQEVLDEQGTGQRG